MKESGPLGGAMRQVRPIDPPMVFYETVKLFCRKIILHDMPETHVFMVDDIHGFTVNSEICRFNEIDINLSLTHQEGRIGCWQNERPLA